MGKGHKGYGEKSAINLFTPSQNDSICPLNQTPVFGQKPLL
jgi:hypothetical protein